MAPKTHTAKFAASLALLVVIGALLFVSPVSAARLADSPAKPQPPTSSGSTGSSTSSNVSEVLAEGVFDLPVVQQPASDAGFVSTAKDTLTQFSLAAQYGNVGLLAHNYLSGQDFLQISLGQRVYLTFGDGHVERYWVSHMYQYEAVDPLSVTSDFIDLDTHQPLTAQQLFTKVYAGPKHLTLQTCITEGGNASAGRLFVIAEPEPADAVTNWSLYPLPVTGGSG